MAPADALPDVSPGRRASGWLTFEADGGQPARVPIVVVRGAASGPTLWTQAGLHRDEGDGIVAMLRWLDGLDPARVRGTVIAVPVVNTPAFLPGAAADPIGRQNLNRSFAGPGETRTERFAAWLLSQVGGRASAFVDLHGGGRSLEVASFAFCGSNLSAAWDQDGGWLLARACGVRYVCAPPAGHVGALYRVLGTRGIPSLLIEAGGGTTWQEDAVAQHILALENIAAALDMAAPVGRPADKAADPVVIGRTLDVYAAEDAIVTRRLTPGSRVGKGEPVIELRTFTGEPRPPIASPLASGIVLSVAASALLRAGAYACLVGETAA